MKLAANNRVGKPDPLLFRLKYCAPYLAKKPAIPEEIAKLSPTYVKVLEQSHAAEHWRLDQIAGVGYRKALEFLIKDYAVHCNKAKKKRIQSAFLGQCINDFVSDHNVQECAKRAVWLGNDETHYMRRWKNKDIEDLKILLHLTEAWIYNELLTKKYIKSMTPRPRRNGKSAKPS